MKYMSINFKHWGEAKEKAEGLNLYVKSHLKEMGRKPKKDVESTICKVYIGGKWKEFDFYRLEDTQKIKCKSKQIIIELPITNDNICKSLYIVNKSAKKSRDTKTKNYYQRNHGMVSRAKKRQNELYDIKNIVISKLINDNVLELIGYHVQLLDSSRNVLLYYKYEEFEFHSIDNEVDEKSLKFLGLIETHISSEVTRKVDIKFNEALQILNKYVAS